MRRRDESFDDIVRDIELVVCRMAVRVGVPIPDPNPFPRMRLGLWK